MSGILFARPRLLVLGAREALNEPSFAVEHLVSRTPAILFHVTPIKFFLRVSLLRILGDAPLLEVSILVELAVEGRIGVTGTSVPMG